MPVCVWAFFFAREKKDIRCQCVAHVCKVMFCFSKRELLLWCNCVCVCGVVWCVCVCACCVFKRWAYLHLVMVEDIHPLSLCWSSLLLWWIKHHNQVKLQWWRNVPKMHNRDMKGSRLINRPTHTPRNRHAHSHSHTCTRTIKSPKCFTQTHTHTHTHTHTEPQADISSRTLPGCVIFEVSQPSAKSGLFIQPGASHRKLWGVWWGAYEIAYIICCNVFPMGWNILSWKWISRSSRHHVARWLSLHFPFSECSIITTAVTFMACARVRLCALCCVRAICSGVSACTRAFLRARLPPYTAVWQWPSVARSWLRQRITSAWLPLESESDAHLSVLAPLVRSRETFIWCAYRWLS